MIYEEVPIDAPVRQGDIFRRVPRVELSLSNLIVNDGVVEKLTTWDQAISANGPISALLPVRPVVAIVITQDCDAARGEHISLCEVTSFLGFLNQESTPPKSPKKWQSLIVESRNNPRLFYLPADSSIDFTTPMAADLRVLIRMARVDLEGMRSGRVGRLNRVASQHFRETLGYFFRRYAFNEWYPLTKEQFAEYQAGRTEPVAPYDWQR